MGRGPKSTKGKAKPAGPRKSRKNEAPKVRDLEKRLADALRDKTEAQERQAEAREQQTATAEILRIISSSPGDAQPVFDAIAVDALRLCDAEAVVVTRYDGTLLRVAALHNVSREAVDRIERQYPRAPSRDLPAGRAILDGVVVHVPDLQAAIEFASSVPRQSGWGSHISIPLLHQGRAIGVIGISRRRRGPFPDRHIELLKTFADQAVIAIENVRLFKELQARNRDLTEALDRQTATSEILGVISSSPTDVRPVFDAIAQNAVRLCGGIGAVVYRFDGEMLQVAGHHQMSRSGLERLERSYPRRPGRDFPPGRAFLDRTVVHVPDLQAATEFAASTARQGGAGSQLAVPLLREGEAIGVIGLARDLVGPFSPEQIAVLQTFADQAVIAIENVRLFNETKEALDQQTATSEILKVISSSPTDVQPVFEAITDSAMRLFRAWAAAVFRYEGQLISMAAARGGLPGSADAVMARLQAPHAPTQERPEGRTALTRTIQHIVDVDNDMSWGARYREDARARGFRSYVAVPMLRGDVVVGVITVSRQQVGGFAPGEISLLQTFADQAVIAIENVRLFTELQAKNRELTEAHAQVSESLGRQTATSDILRVISQSQTDSHPVFDAIVRSAAQLCDATFAALHQFDGRVVTFEAHHGMTEEEIAGSHARFPLPIDRGTAVSRAILDRQIIHIDDIGNDPEYRVSAWQTSFRTVLAVPLLREDVPVGAIGLWRREVHPFSEKQIKLVETFADQAVIAIENVRLFTELEARNDDLTEALDQQTATSEVLKVISRSTFDLQPVLEILIENATRLCGAQQGFLFTSDGELHHLAVEYNAPPAFKEWVLTHPSRTGDASVVGRVAREGRVVQILDAQADAAWRARNAGAPGLSGVRSLLGVPMRREGTLVGVIAMWRTTVRPYTDKERQLVETFAAQAVIAIENVRLVTELQARTQQLTRSVEQLTALREVGRAVSSSLDLETVLNTIVARAVQLAGAHSGTIWEYDAAAQEFVLRITQNVEDPELRANPNARVRRGEGAVGRLAISQRPVQIPDITHEGAYEGRLRDSLVGAGTRALLAIPLLHEDQLLGGLVISRRTPGEFPAEVVELLASFATQSALALQNARLFLEIGDKSRQLEAASQHKSEFLANMSHELRTPLNAIIGFSEVLSEKMFGELNEKQEEYSKDIHASGQHLLSLINDVLDLSKIEAGRMELELSDFHLPTALDSALTLVRERAGRRSIALHLSVDERLGEIQGDERKVRQVVLNLLSNAIKFTPEGGRVEVRATPQDGLVEVSVSDTGVGIAPDDQEAVFEEFRQVGTVDKKVEGTGLGLTLCRKFVELHGGRIWVKSQVGEGSTFTFTIPVHRGE